MSQWLSCDFADSDVEPEADVSDQCTDIPSNDVGMPCPVQDASNTLHDSTMDMEIGIPEQNSDVIDDVSGETLVTIKTLVLQRKHSVVR